MLVESLRAAARPLCPTWTFWPQAGSGLFSITASTRRGIFPIYTGSGTAFAANIEDNTVVTPVNGWYHFVITCDGSTVVLYVNGQRINTSAIVNYGPAPAAQLIFGSRSDGSYTLDGSYDEGAVYTNALSAAQVLAHFQNGTNTSPAQSYQSLILADHPVGYWRFSEPTFTPTAPPAANIGTLGSSANGNLRS